MTVKLRLSVTFNQRSADSLFMNRRVLLSTLFCGLVAFAEASAQAQQHVDPVVQESTAAATKSIGPNPFSGLSLRKPLKFADLFNSLSVGFAPAPRAGGTPNTISCLTGKNTCPPPPRTAFNSVQALGTSFGDSTMGDENSTMLLFMKGFERAVDADINLGQNYAQYTARMRGESSKISPQVVIPNNSVLDAGKIFNAVFGTEGESTPTDWFDSMNRYYQLKGKAVGTMDDTLRFKYWTYLQVAKASGANPNSAEAKTLLLQAESQLTNAIALEIVRESRKSPTNFFIAKMASAAENPAYDAKTKPSSASHAPNPISEYLNQEKTVAPIYAGATFSDFVYNVNQAEKNLEHINDMDDQTKAITIQTIRGYRQVEMCVAGKIQASVDGLQPSELTKNADLQVNADQVDNFDTEVKSSLLECYEPFVDPDYFTRDANGKLVLQTDMVGLGAPPDILDFQMYMDGELYKYSQLHWNRIRVRYAKGESLSWGDAFFVAWERKNKGESHPFLPKGAFDNEWPEQVKESADRLKQRYNVTLRNDECMKSVADTSKTFNFGDYKTIKYNNCPHLVLKGSKLFLPATDVFTHPEDLLALYNLMGAEQFDAFIMTNVYLAKNADIEFPLFSQSEDNKATLQTLHLLLCHQEPDVIGGASHPCYDKATKTLGAHPGLTKILAASKKFSDETKIVISEGGARNRTLVPPKITLGNPQSPLFSTERPYVLQDSVFILGSSGPQQYDYIDYVKTARSKVDAVRDQLEKMKEESQKLLTFMNGLKHGSAAYFESLTNVARFVDPTTLLWKAHKYLKENNESGGTDELRRYEKMVKEDHEITRKLNAEISALGIRVRAGDHNSQDEMAHFADAYGQVVDEYRKQDFAREQNAVTMWYGDTEHMPETFLQVMNAQFNPFAEYSMGLATSSIGLTADILSLPLTVPLVGGASLGVVNSTLGTSKLAMVGIKASRATKTMENSWQIAKSLRRLETYTDMAVTLGRAAKTPVVTSKNLLTGVKESRLANAIRSPFITSKNVYKEAKLSHAATNKLVQLWNPRSATSAFSVGFGKGSAESWRFFWMMKGIGGLSTAAGSAIKHGVAAFQGDTMTGEELQTARDYIYQSVIGGNNAKDLALMNGIIRGGDVIARGSTTLARAMYRGSEVAAKAERVAVQMAKVPMLERRIQLATTAGRHTEAQGLKSTVEAIKKLGAETPQWMTREKVVGNIMGNIPMSVYFNRQSWAVVQDERDNISKQVESLKQQIDMETKRGNTSAVQVLQREVEHLGNRKWRAWGSFVVDVGVDLFFTVKFVKMETWATSDYRPRAIDHKRHIQNILEGYVKREGIVRERDGGLTFTPEQYRKVSRLMEQENRKFTTQLDTYLAGRPTDKPATSMYGTTYMPYSVLDETPAITNMGFVKVFPDQGGWLNPGTPPSGP